MAKEKNQKNKERLSGKESRLAEDNKIMAVFSYLWVLCLVPLLLRRDSEFLQFHARQGLVLFIASFLAWFPFLGQILGLVILVVAILAMIKAYNGEEWKIPLVYELSKKINL